VKNSGIITLLIFIAVLASALTPAASLPLPNQTPATAPAPQAQAAAPGCPELARALTDLMRNDARLRDWANLGRYREANHALPTPAGTEVRVVFMGDSITDFWQQPRFGGFFPDKPYVDRGISGQTTSQMLVRFHSDVVNLKPRAVVILAGTNDIAGNTGPMTNAEIQGNLAAMSEIAQANGIRVVLSSILPVSAYHNPAAPQTTTRPLSRILAVNEWVKSYAAAHGCIYLDYFSAMVDSSGLLQEALSSDDLHPNAKGYALMAPLAEAAIARALKQ
jgi:lysophospholipase L1-like esterase